MTAKKAILWLLVFVFLVALAWLGVNGVRAACAARLALADLERLQALAGDASPAALPAARGDLAALEAHLTTARSAGRPFLWLAPKLGWAPRYGPTLAAAPALLDMARELAGGGREALDALAPLTDKLGDGQGLDLLAEALPVISAAAPQLKDADARLARAQALRAGIGGDLHPRLAEQLPRLDRLLPLARAGLQAAQVAPALLGADGPRTYLILAQNNHELRGTGGFISGAGFVRLDGGRITDLRLSDAYSVDDLTQPHPAPPRAMTEQMGIQLLTLRDSNWSPDFPESSEVARALFAAGSRHRHRRRDRAGPGGGAPPGRRDGAVTGARRRPASDRRESVGLDETLVGCAAKRRGHRRGSRDLRLVAQTQGLHGRNDGRRVGEASGRRRLECVCTGAGGGGDARRPASPGGRGRSRRWRKSWPSRGGMAVCAHPRRATSWPWSMPTSASTRPTRPWWKISRTASSRRTAAWTATLTLTYTHTAPSGAEPVCDRTPRYGDSYDALVNRCYWDYLRVYAPAGSELLTAEGLNRPAAEQGERGTTVFAGSFSLRPGDQHVVTLQYRLPADLPTAPYRLFVRKQAGTLAPPLTVEAPDAVEVGLGADRTFECMDAAEP